MSNQKFNDPADLQFHGFFKGLQYVGPLIDEIPKVKLYHQKLRLSGTTEFQLKSEDIPILCSKKDVKNAYQNADYGKIKNLEKASLQDIGPIHNNIKEHGLNAWSKVRKDGQEFYMSWSNTGSVWIFPQTTNKLLRLADGETKYQSVVQYGTLSTTGQILGINNYNITTTSLLADSIFALIVSKLVTSVISDGTSMALASLLTRLGSFVADLGIESAAFVVPEAAVSGLVCSFVFIVVFIGIMVLWNWLNKKYTIKLQIFNWDENNDWDIANDYYLDNAKLANGQESQKKMKITIPKMAKPGSIITPPGFNDVELLENTCYYCTIIFENDNTFLEGCSFAIKFQKTNSDQGFTYAFECPRFQDNKQAAADGLRDPKSYYDKVEWNSSPRKFNIYSTPDRVPISFHLDALSGGEDDTYHPILNISNS